MRKYVGQAMPEPELLVIFWGYPHSWTYPCKGKERKGGKRKGLCSCNCSLALSKGQKRKGYIAGTVYAGSLAEVEKVPVTEQSGLENKHKNIKLSKREASVGLVGFKHHAAPEHQD
eukprot:2040-Pelagomonas_calceolata.AAC.4